MRAFQLMNNDGNNGRRIGGRALREVLKFKKYGTGPHAVFYESQAAMDSDLGRGEYTPHWSGYMTDEQATALLAALEAAYQREFGVTWAGPLELYHD